METKKVSARTKFTERHSTAHRGRLKQLLIEAFLGRKKCTSGSSCPWASFFWIAQKNQIEKKTFFVSKCEKYKEHRGTAQRGRPKLSKITPLFGRNEDRQIAVIVQKRQRTSGYGPTGTLTTHTEKKSGKKNTKMQKKCKQSHQKMQQKCKNCKKHAKNAKKHTKNAKNQKKKYKMQSCKPKKN